MSDLDIELDSQDDEIIELEDIIEMPSGSIDEDEDLDLGAEILDADADLDLEPEPVAAKKGRSPLMGKPPVAPPRGEEDDLLKAFGDEEDEEDLFGSVSAKSVAKTPKAKEPPQDFDDDDLFEPEIVKGFGAKTPVAEPEPSGLGESDDSLLDDLLGDAKAPEPEPPREKAEKPAVAEAQEPTVLDDDLQLLDDELISDATDRDKLLDDGMQAPARAAKAEEAAFDDSGMPLLDDEFLGDDTGLPEKGAQPPTRTAIPQEAAFDDSDMSLIDDELLGDTVERPQPQTKELRAEPEELPETAAPPLQAVEEPRKPEPELKIADEAWQTSPGIAAAVEPSAVPSEAELVVEELIARMEERLADKIRAVVEARLPDVVRSIIQEELEKLKDEAE